MLVLSLYHCRSCYRHNVSVFLSCRSAAWEYQESRSGGSAGVERWQRGCSLRLYYYCYCRQHVQALYDDDYTQPSHLCTQDSTPTQDAAVSGVVMPPPWDYSGMSLNITVLWLISVNTFLSIAISFFLQCVKTVNTRSLEKCICVTYWKQVC